MVHHNTITPDICIMSRSMYHVEIRKCIMSPDLNYIQNSDQYIDTPVKALNNKSKRTMPAEVIIQAGHNKSSKVKDEYIMLLKEMVMFEVKYANRNKFHVRLLFEDIFWQVETTTFLVA